MSPWPHTPAQAAEIFKQNRDDPWIWFLEIEVTTATNVVDALRLVNNPVALNWGTFSDGTAKPWSPFLFKVGQIQTGSEGDLRTLSISASNVSRDAEAVLELYEGLEGMPVKLYLVDGSRLDDDNPYWFGEGQVLTAATDTQTASIQFGQQSIQTFLFPVQRVQRAICRHWSSGDYGGTLCGYDVLRAGAYQTCDGTFDGGNGCIAHGEEEDAAGVAKIHPLRYGGIRGIPRKTGLGAT